MLSLFHMPSLSLLTLAFIDNIRVLLARLFEMQTFSGRNMYYRTPHTNIHLSDSFDFVCVVISVAFFLFILCAVSVGCFAFLMKLLFLSTQYQARSRYIHIHVYIFNWEFFRGASLCKMITCVHKSSEKTENVKHTRKHISERTISKMIIFRFSFVFNPGSSNCSAQLICLR